MTRRPCFCCCGEFWTSVVWTPERGWFKIRSERLAGYWRLT